MTLTTIDTTAPTSIHTETGPLDEAVTHKVLFTAAAVCEDDVIEQLAAARQRGDENAVRALTAERNLFDRLATDLRTNALTAAAAKAADER